jgi:hypothetical protein
MANVFELFDSADRTTKDRAAGGDQKYRYGVNECSDQVTAEQLVRQATPLAFETSTGEILVRQSLTSKPEGLDYFICEVSYGPEDEKDSQQKPEPGVWKFEFDTTGNKQKITAAPLVSRHWGSSFGEAPILEGAMNFDGHKVQGLEVPVPNGKFTITQYYDPRYVTPALFKTFKKNTPRVNSDPWLGHDPGEVLYYGSKGSGDIPTVAGQRVQPIAIVHHFDSSENDDNVSVEDSPDGGNVITEGKYGPAAFDALGTSLNGQPAEEVAKDGWDYLWVWYKKREDEDTFKVVPRPAHVYVHRPFKRIKFADFFGFGGSS